MSFFFSFLVIKRDALLADLISGTDWLAPGNEGEGSTPIKHLQNFCFLTVMQSIGLTPRSSSAFCLRYLQLSSSLTEVDDPDSNPYKSSD
jgi:hypothetical protein